ncbi:MAG TPA: 2'-5' RNA ligase family protein [Terriglobales bacterium]|jgi:2'-5' RNA ligase|nr:2'-5' RNA ligase family protein [Terriglobales bacterium]
MAAPQYALVAYVTSPVAGFVEGLRRQFHPRQAHLPAHVSVLPPRRLKGTEAQALDSLESVCSAVEPFEIVLGEVATFVPATPTVFLRVAHAAYRMRELHDRLNVAALHGEEQWPYMPHLTIFRMDTVEEALAASEEARRRWEEYRESRRVLIERVTFVREAGPNCWTDLAPVPLGRRLAPTR